MEDEMGYVLAGQTDLENHGGSSDTADGVVSRSDISDSVLVVDQLPLDRDTLCQYATEHPEQLQLIQKHYKALTKPVVDDYISAVRAEEEMEFFSSVNLTQNDLQVLNFPTEAPAEVKSFHEAFVKHNLAAGGNAKLNALMSLPGIMGKSISSVLAEATKIIADSGGKKIEWERNGLVRVVTENGDVLNALESLDQAELDELTEIRSDLSRLFNDLEIGTLIRVVQSINSDADTVRNVKDHVSEPPMLTKFFNEVATVGKVYDLAFGYKKFIRKSGEEIGLSNAASNGYTYLTRIRDGETISFSMTADVMNCVDAFCSEVGVELPYYIDTRIRDISTVLGAGRDHLESALKDPSVIIETARKYGIQIHHDLQEPSYGLMNELIDVYSKIKQYEEFRASAIAPNKAARRNIFINETAYKFAVDQIQNELQTVIHERRGAFQEVVKTATLINYSVINALGLSGVVQDRMAGDIKDIVGTCTDWSEGSQGVNTVLGILFVRYHEELEAGIISQGQLDRVFSDVSLNSICNLARLLSANKRHVDKMMTSEIKLIANEVQNMNLPTVKEALESPDNSGNWFVSLMLRKRLAELAK